MSRQETKGVALITGASAGIGATYADRLARRGFDLLLVARDRQRLEELAARLRAEAGVAVEFLAADLTVRDDLLAVERRLREDSAITFLVNNAGIGPNGPLLGADVDYLDRMIQLNVTALNRLAIAAASTFVPRGHGTIVNLASVVALVPEMFNGTYGGTKAFVLALTQALQREVGDSGVRLQAVLPGLTRTEIFERAGMDIGKLDPAMVMDVGDMVDAALAGLDQGEFITIPSLPDPAAWHAAVAARMTLAPDLSKSRPAPRYGVG
ncbi:MAG: SDR family oxidoreductase [Geminicoccaceae bacterium]